MLSNAEARTRIELRDLQGKAEETQMEMHAQLKSMLLEKKALDEELAETKKQLQVAFNDAWLNSKKLLSDATTLASENKNLQTQVGIIPAAFSNKQQLEQMKATAKLQNANMEENACLRGKLAVADADIRV